MIGSTTLFASPPQPPGYIDSSVCGGCHQEIARSFRLTGMGRSAGVLTPQNVIENFRTQNDFYHQPSDRYYKMAEIAGKYVERRQQTGFNGQITNLIEKQIEFFIGSGNHARTYLYRNSEGTLMEMPVSWYSERGGYWGMSPGYDRADQEDFRRIVPSECLFCHSAYPTGRASAAQTPKAIDCQRCHGPGQVHAELAGSGKAAPDAVSRAIVNPARLSRDRQLDVCMQCHLETTSTPLPDSIRRYNRDVFSYRPGEPLSDYRITFDRGRGADEDRFEIAHAAYRLRKSACFLKSQMTCTTCHNPHQEIGSTERYITACRSCHAAVHAAESLSGSCIDCHMPKRRAEDAVHVVMTDHYIQRRKPNRDLTAPLEEADPHKSKYMGPVVAYPRQLAPTPENQLYLDVAQVQQGADLLTGIPGLQETLAKYQPREARFYFELGEAYVKAGKNGEAIHWYQQALIRKPDFTGATRQLVAALFATGQFERATTVLENALVHGTPDSTFLTNLGNAYLRQKKVIPAKQTLERSLQFNPDVPETYNLLGLLLAQESYFRKAIELEPEFAVAHSNLANLLVEKGDYAQASYHFQKSLAFDAASAETHQRYGLLLELMSSYDQALAELREAVRLNPGFVQAHCDLGDLLSARREYTSAAEEYRAAIRENPKFADGYFGLASVLVKQGDLSGAESQLRNAIKINSDFYEAHLMLGNILAHTGKTAEARMHFAKAAQSPDTTVREAARKDLR
jgi:tetratricopeptide (TPR) repeat protein